MAPSPSSFPQFPALPPELRTLIWELCLPSHVIRLSRLAPTTLSRNNRRKPPLIARVCHESRAVALANHPSRRRPCDKPGL